MAKRKSRKSRRRGLSDCGCGPLAGLGMETPEGYLTVQRAGGSAPLQPASGGGTGGLLIKGLVVLAAAGAGWFGYKKFFSTP